jgi:hypothetical protein
MRIGGTPTNRAAGAPARRASWLDRWRRISSGREVAHGVMAAAPRAARFARHAGVRICY